MAGKSRRQFLAGIPAVLNASASLQSTSAGNDSNEYVLWYRQPAPAWTHALPIGNGRLGAMVFGGIDTEHLQLNEDTLWSGAPHDWNNPDASAVSPIYAGSCSTTKTIMKLTRFAKRCRVLTTSRTSRSAIYS